VRTFSSHSRATRSLRQSSKALLLSHPKVMDAAVIGVLDEERQAILKACAWTSGRVRGRRPGDPDAIELASPNRHQERLTLIQR